MFVMFRFELKLSVTISNWVTSYTLHGVGLCWRDSSRLPSVIRVGAGAGQSSLEPGWELISQLRLRQGLDSLLYPV